MSRVAEQLITGSVPVRRRPKATLLIGLVLTGIIVLIALVYQWMGSEQRQARRRDRAEERSGDADQHHEHGEYRPRD